MIPLVVFRSAGAGSTTTRLFVPAIGLMLILLIIISIFGLLNLHLSLSTFCANGKN
jgi:hypothetical protein